MSEISIQEFIPTDRRENGLYIVNLASLKGLVSFEIKVSQLIYLPPHAVGGNHKHPRLESFACLTAGVDFHWIDISGKRQVKAMFTDNNASLKIFTVSPNVPHALKNNNDYPVTVLEFAHAKQHGVEMVQVV